MKKTILASAIAAATFSGAAVAGAHESKNLPTIYGNIQYAVEHENVDGGGSQLNHKDNGSTLGVTHSHEIAPGVTGFFKLELEGINANDKAESSGINDLDEAYIGVKSAEFGQVWIGSDDSMYETAIDTIANFYEIGTNIKGSYDTGEGDLIQYLSPSFNGLTLGAAVQVNGDSKTGGKSYPFQLAAMYEVDNLELAFAVDSNDGYLEYSSANVEGQNNENTYGLRATYNLDDLSLTGEFQTRKDVADVFGVLGVYTLGANQFALGYQLKDDDNTGDKTNEISLQALHNVSEHLYVYVEGYFRNSDNDAEFTLEGASGDEQTVAAIGAVYHF